MKSPRERLRGNIVAYVRVSTQEQMDAGDSLKGQLDAIKRYAENVNRKLVGIYTDSKSGALPFPQRNSLKAAIRKAEELGCPIVVTSPDRLSRNLDVLKHLDLRKTQIWVVGRGRLTRAELELEIAEAEAELEQRSEAGSLSWSPSARKKRSFVSSQRKRDGGRAGSLANQIRAERNVNNIRKVLETRPEAQSMTRRELVQFLNDLGVKNDNGRDPYGPVPWTFDTLKRPLRRAREAIEANSEPLKAGFVPTGDVELV